MHSIVIIIIAQRIFCHMWLINAKVIVWTRIIFHCDVSKSY